MADKVQIVIEVDGSQGTAAIQQIKSGLSSLGPAGSSAGQTASTGIGQINRGLSSMSEQLRSLATSIGGALAFRKLTTFMSGTITASNQLRNSQLGLQSSARNLGLDVGAVTAASKELAKDGFLTLADASKGLQNLLASGLSLPQATHLMQKNKDAAIFNRQAHLGLSESQRVFTQGFKDEISTLTDATGVSTNYSRALGDTFKLVKAGQIDFSKYRDQFTQAEIATLRHTVASVKSAEQLDKTNRSVLAMIGFLRELERDQGNAALGAGDLQVAQNKLNDQIQKTEAAVGQALTPAYKKLLDAGLPLLQQVGAWVELHPDLTVGILGTATAVGVLAASVGALAFALPQLIQGFTFLRGLGGVGAGGALAGRFLAGGVIGGLSLGAAGVALDKLNEEQEKNEQLRKEIEVGGLANSLGLSGSEIAAIRSASKGFSTDPEALSFEDNIKKIAEARSGLKKGVFLGATAQEANALRVKKELEDKLKALGLGGGGGEGKSRLLPLPHHAPRSLFQGGQVDLTDPRFQLDLDLSARIQDMEEIQRVQEEIERAGFNTRLSVISNEAERRSLENERRAREATKTIDDLTERERVFNEAKAAFDAESAAQLSARNRDRALSLQEEVALLQAEVGGGIGGGAGARFARQLSRLGVQQSFDIKRARREGASPEVLALLAERHHLEVIRLQQDRYQDLYNNIADHAGRVWDGMFQKGKNVFTALGDTIKGIWLTTMRKMFSDFVAGLLTPVFSRLSGGFGGLGGAAAPAGARGGFGGLLNFGGLFGGGGGGSLGGFRTPPFLPGGAGGGPLSLLGLGGAGAAAGLTPGVAAALPTTFTNTGLLPTGAAAGGAAGGGFSLFGLSGAQLGAFFTNPFTIAIGAAIGGAILFSKLRKSREDKFREEILRDFAINVSEKRILQQIKRLGENAFGREADRKRFETLRLDPVQSLLLNYAQQTGQSPALLPLYQRFFGSGRTPQSLSFDPSRGIPAFGNGGIVTRPTLALIGERGPEAIVPLSRGGSSTAPVFNITTNVDATGATDPAAIGRAVETAVGRAVEKILESGKIGAKTIDRAVVRLVNRGLAGDYRRRDVLGSLLGG